MTINQLQLMSGAQGAFGRDLRDTIELMNQPVLYLMLGYPGAGKTTTAKVIHELTGAVHLWADQIRRERFKRPTYSHDENLELYNHLNELTAELLRTGQSVVFDTAFNFSKDRRKLREIASNHGAKTTLVWVTTPKDTSRSRALHHEAHLQPTRPIGGDMTSEHFERIANNLEEPEDNEAIIKVDGTKVTKDYIKSLLVENQR